MYEFKQIKDVRGRSKRDRSLAATSMGRPSIYTDGSKEHESGKVAVGISIPEIGYRIGYRVSDHMSVFTAEMVAVLWALRWVEDNKQGYSIICSDSAAALISIKEGKSKSRPG